jgi:hypothetical protein
MEDQPGQTTEPDYVSSPELKAWYRIFAGQAAQQKCRLVTEKNRNHWSRKAGLPRDEAQALPALITS